MHRFCGLLALLAVAVAVETCSAQDVAAFKRATFEGCDGGAAIWDGAVNPGGTCDSCAPCFPSCGLGDCLRSCCGHHRRSRLVTETGDFNCNCRGSYKFPVPPQYTYHWPGIYSQQSMTEYTSPWRFPALKTYHDELAQQDAAASKLVRLPSPPRGEEFSPSASTSDKIKRWFGVR
ncbi:MAG: hypothetical protein JXB62_21745 [Pirellulales bacterium]|nr:hypothetical protein [Pirellulales bacterium]